MNTVLFFLHPLSLAVALACWIFFRSVKSKQGATESAYVSLVLAAAYAVGFLETCRDPSWIDNESRKSMDWAQRLFFSLPTASIAELVLLPAWMAARFVWRRRASGRQ